MQEEPEVTTWGASEGAVRPTRRSPARVRARAPGRVNLIGDHTDYTGGLVLPMAIDRETTVAGIRAGGLVRLQSTDEEGEAAVPLEVDRPADLQPSWARYVGGVVAVVRPSVGLTGTVRTNLPIAAGLASSAALEVAVALALGFQGSPRELALACQRAEHLASGVPCGVMDQLASAAGVEGHALLVDCTTLELRPVPLPPDIEVVVVHSGAVRALAVSAYSERRAACDAAARLVGPLRLATPAEVEAIPDEVLRRRARHVVSENARVSAFVAALAAGDVAGAGRLMVESHRSLRDDFDVSTPALDTLVARLLRTPGVLGARLTGAGFGGCVVGLVRSDSPAVGWRVRPTKGASVEQE